MCNTYLLRDTDLHLQVQVWSPWAITPNPPCCSRVTTCFGADPSTTVLGHCYYCHATMPFPLGRLEIWGFAVSATAQRRRVVEQNFQVFPTLDLVASPLFSVNRESREVAGSFYPVRLKVYRRNPYRTRSEDDASREPLDSKGFVHTCPELDDIVSVFQRVALYYSELRLELLEESKLTAWYYYTEPMAEETRRLFYRRLDDVCLVRYTSGHCAGLVGGA
ncbi:hypothetical protein F5Y03DRAFT_342481 [Xylaria venustula]|nr:hypothetical protein F5Y03DRAFT_342481 [Xylaria venustula]